MLRVFLKVLARNREYFGQAVGEPQTRRIVSILSLRTAPQIPLKHTVNRTASGPLCACFTAGRLRFSRRETIVVEIEPVVRGPDG
jgi:hypothetical protein